MFQYNVNSSFCRNIFDSEVFTPFVFHLFQVVHEFYSGLFAELVNDLHKRSIFVVQVYCTVLCIYCATTQ